MLFKMLFQILFPLSLRLLKYARIKLERVMSKINSSYLVNAYKIPVLRMIWNINYSFNWHFASMRLNHYLYFPNNVSEESYFWVKFSKYWWQP